MIKTRKDAKKDENCDFRENVKKRTIDSEYALLRT